MFNLKPCPFCGSPARIHVRPKSDWRHEGEPVYMPQCTWNKCIARASRGYPSEEEATSVWNHRPEKEDMDKNGRDQKAL